MLENEPILIFISLLLLLILSNIKNIIKASTFIKELIQSHTVSQSERNASKFIQKLLTESRTELKDHLDLDILPLDFQIKWHNRKTSPHINNENEVVIILDEDQKSLTENFALSVYQYSSLSVLHDTRKYISNDISTAIDLVVTKKILNTKKQDGLDFFENKILKKEIESNNTNKTYVDTLITLDQTGLFTRIFLNELNEYGKRMHHTIPNKFIKIDELKYMEYFKSLAHKKPKVDIKIPFIKGDKLQIGIVFIAGDYLERYELKCYKNPLSTPYGKHITQLINNDINSIYLISIGKKFNKYAAYLSDTFEKNSCVDYIKKQKYSISTNEAFVGLIRLKLKIT